MNACAEPSKQSCVHCKTTEKELRPYGPNGAWVCYDCAMSPEHKEETRINFDAQLRAAAKVNPIVVIDSEHGPIPASSDPRLIEMLPKLEAMLGKLEAGEINPEDLEEELQKLNSTNNLN